MVLDAKTPVSAYKCRDFDGGECDGEAGPPSGVDDEREEVSFQASRVKTANGAPRLTRFLESVEKEAPGGSGGAWWGQAADDSDDDDLVGGGMGRAADAAAAAAGDGVEPSPRQRMPLPFSAARTARGKLAGDGKCRCPVCLGEFERNEMVLLSHCNHPFCAPCVEAWAARRARSCPLCKKEFTGWFHGVRGAAVSGGGAHRS